MNNVKLYRRAAIAALVLGMAVGMLQHPASATPRGVKEKVTVEKVRGNKIYTTDGRVFSTDGRKKGYIPRNFKREQQLQGQEIEIRHVKREYDTDGAVYIEKE